VKLVIAYRNVTSTKRYKRFFLKDLCVKKTLTSKKFALKFLKNRWIYTPKLKTHASRWNLGKNKIFIFNISKTN